MPSHRRFRRMVVSVASVLVAAGIVAVGPSAPVLADQSEGGRPDLVINQRKITAGAAHTCALLDDGHVQCWGSNLYGDMGNDTIAVPTAARVVKDVELATSVSAGASHTCALIYDGTVKCWGLNGSGQLGDGTTISRDSGVAVTGLDDATAIASGGFHACALVDGGAVKCWGHDGSGQLGNGPEDPLDPAGGTSLVPVAVTGITNATALTAGEFHTCALIDDGTVKCWGHNGFGQLGNGANLADGINDDADTPVSVSGIPDGDTRKAWAIVGGYGHTCAVVDDDATDLLENSKLLCWGDNSQGQLGDNTRTTRTTPTKVKRDQDPNPLVTDLVDFEGATSVTAGQFHTCVRKFGFEAWCWGNASRGQIGNGTTGDEFALNAQEKQMWKTPQQASGSGYTAVTAGGFHTCGLAGTSVTCWGYNHYGQVGRYQSSNATPIPVTALSGATTVATGTTHACALVEGSGDPPPLEAACWGSNASGQLGAGLNPSDVADTMAPVDVVGLPDNDAIAAGNGHSCVLPDSPGTPKCWGFNNTGQLGDGTTTNATSPVTVGGGLTTATQLSAHGALGSAERGHTCARRSDGTAQCWGRNFNGQLGDGTNTDSATPVTVKYDNDDNPDTAPVALTGITSVATGGFHSCARMDNATVRCWGFNGQGQLGTGDFASSNLAVVAVYDSDGDPSDGHEPVDIAAAVAAGLNHTCVVRTSGAYRCWGDNSQGQIGDGTTVDRPLATLVTGVPQGTNRSRDISLGDDHTCGVLSNTSVRCWGDNSSGQLGRGFASDFESTPGEPVGLGNDAADEAISQPETDFYVGNVSAARNNTCASRVDKAVVCWGDNAFGQLGYGFGDSDGTDSRVPVTVNVLTGGVGSNLVPTPKDDSYTTDPDEPVAIAVGANDTDMDGDTLTFAVTDSPDHGTVLLFNTSNGTGTYSPNPGFCGADSFTYTASDAHASSPATVSITVTCPNQGPEAVDDAASVAEDSPVTVDVLANDTDPEGDGLSVTAVGSAAQGSTSADGTTVTYTPNVNFCGPDMFTYTIDDSAPGNGGDTANVDVTVTCVNDPPVAADDAVAATEDTPTVIDVVVNDDDVEDPGALVIVAVGSASHGTTAVTSPTQVTYTPDANFCGSSDSFTYTISDPDGGTANATVTITGIDCVADGPSAQDDAATTPEDTPIVVAVLANDSDADPGDSLTVVSTTNGATGTTTTDGATVTYTPNADFCGGDSFTYTVQDGSGNSAVASVAITVDCSNDAPAAVPDLVATDEDTPLGINPLANDSDPDGDPLTLQWVTDPAHGTASIQMGGGVLYAPDENYCGSDTFDYSVADDNGSASVGTVTIDVTCVNDAPVLAPIADRTTEWGTAVNVTAAAIDPDSAVTYSLVTAPVGASIDPSTGAFSWTPANTQTGVHTVTLQASDGALSDDESFNITVTDRATTLTYTGAASGEYSDPVTVSGVLNDASGGVGGKTVKFTIGSQEAFAVTAAGTGVATASIILDGVAGPTSVNVSFPGDTDYTGSATSSSFVIEKETVVTSFAGTHVTPTSATSAPVTLSALVVEPDDGAPGAGPGGAKVDFRTVGGSVLCSAIASATGPSEAIATCVAPSQVVGSKAVILLLDDGRYRSGVDVAAFTVSHDASGTAAGGGAVGSADDFAFQAKAGKGKDASPSGSAVHVYRSGGTAIVVATATLTSFGKECSGGKTKVCSVTVAGSGASRWSVDLETAAVTTLTGSPGLTVQASDVAEPGAGSDTYGVTITAPDSRSLAPTAINAGNIRVF